MSESIETDKKSTKIIASHIQWIRMNLMKLKKMLKKNEDIEKQNVFDIFKRPIIIGKSGKKNHVCHREYIKPFPKTLSDCIKGELRLTKLV